MKLYLFFDYLALFKVNEGVLFIPFFSVNQQR